MSRYRKAFVSAFTAIGVVVARVWPELDGLAEAIAAVGAVLVWYIPNSPYADDGSDHP